MIPGTRMLNCPTCHTPMKRTPHERVWKCAQCASCATTVAALRSFCEPRLVQEMWQAATASAPSSRRSCPACENRMREMAIGALVPGLNLDICTPCGFVWFDPGELAELPKARALSAQGEELVGRLEAELIGERPNVAWAKILRHPLPADPGLEVAVYLIRALAALLYAIVPRR